MVGGDGYSQAPEDDWGSRNKAELLNIYVLQYSNAEDFENEMYQRNCGNTGR
jgi:hypothetical protein